MEDPRYYLREAERCMEAATSITCSPDRRELLMRQARQLERLALVAQGIVPPLDSED
jgi:hypothetical protein